MNGLVQTLVLLMMMSVMKAELFKQFVLKIEDYVKRLDDAITINIQCNQTVQQSADIVANHADQNADIERLKAKIEELNTTVTTQAATIQAIENAQNGKANVCIRVCQNNFSDAFPLGKILTVHADRVKFFEACWPQNDSLLDQT